MTAAHLRGPEVQLERKQGCTGKIGFMSRVETMKVIKTRWAGENIARPYQCKHCPLWHITTRRRLDIQKKGVV